MNFIYADVIQRTEPWFEIRRGKVTASRLCDWLAVSKAKGKEGTPLKSRLDYERELWFERTFGVSYNNYVSGPMLDGQFYEDFVRNQYELIKGITAESCGCWYNELFCASPDGTIGSDGLLEIKVVRDNTFTDILIGGVPENHFQQIQGQLFASGRDWCDYAAFNISTKKISIWRVEPNLELIKNIEESIQVPISVEEIPLTELYDVAGDIPQVLPELQENESIMEEKKSW